MSWSGKTAFLLYKFFFTFSFEQLNFSGIIRRQSIIKQVLYAPILHTVFLQLRRPPFQGKIGHDGMSIVNKYVFDICFKFHVLTLVTLGLKRQQSTSNWTSTSYQAWWFWHFSLCDLLSLASRRRRHRNPQRGVKEGIQTKWIFQYSFFHLLIWFLFFS